MLWNFDLLFKVNSVMIRFTIRDLFGVGRHLFSLKAENFTLILFYFT